MTSNQSSTATKYLCMILCFLLIIFFVYKLIRKPESSHKFITSERCLGSNAAVNNTFYSQFLEDYILAIIFKDIKKGTYIDVGANNPNNDSVTNYFYLKGWRGINIEPIDYWYKELVKFRPNDINLNIGISDRSENLILSVISTKNNKLVDVLSTFDPTVLKTALHDGYSYTSRSVPVKPLNDVLQDYHMKDINFISIDVEGMEAKVLHGIDLKKHRPWVFIIEAVEPRTITRSDGKWKNILTDNNYIYVMFDGINVYYVAKEHYKQLHNNFKKAYSCALDVNKKYHVINNKLDYAHST